MDAYRVLLYLFLSASVEGYRVYQDRIPNGDNIPHPCKPNYLWRGVGHMNPLGGGPRNPFGKDYGNYGQWSPELCRVDSDGDGKTNGEELGDPNCVWKENTIPQTDKGITHPGVCDPWGSPQCQEVNKDVTCDTGEFVCPGINSLDVFNITLQFPETKVPPQETTYICITFELDMLEPGVDYHLIATKPFIDNAYVLHHTVLTGCGHSSKPLAEPEECLMGQSDCQQTMSIWTIGLAGECVHPDAGFKIGTNGVKRLSMQHHWTNPELQTHYVDKSGMTLYLTKKLRQYNAAYFSTGDLDLVIPPGQSRHTVKSSCSSTCTQKLFKDNIYLMTGLNHMHYLGYQQNVEHFRQGEKLPDLTPEMEYSYDNPKVFMYNPPVEVRPGDNLMTTCVFRSTSRKQTTFIGAGTYDEMCFAFFTYYPAENVNGRACITGGDLEYCLRDEEWYGCSHANLFNSSHSLYKETIMKVLDNCNYDGYCRNECPSVLKEVRQHPCFSPKMERTTMRNAWARTDTQLHRFVSAYQSCDCSVEPTDVTAAGTGPLATSCTVFFLVVLYLAL